MPGAADIMMRVGADGTIREASFGLALSSEDPAGWVGQAWADTVTPATRTKVARLMDEARNDGVSGFRQVNHTMPSGSEIPVEYAAIRVGDDGALVAVGRSLLVVGELQQRLVNAQQALERDHWRLREIETRYRLLFHRSPEAILVVSPESGRIIDTNPAADELLGLPRANGASAGGGRILADAVDSRDRARLADHVSRAAQTGRSEPIRLVLSDPRRTVDLRAVLMGGDDEPLLLLHANPAATAAPGAAGTIDFHEVAERVPDGVVVVDPDGTVVWANRRLLSLIQVPAIEDVVREPIARWLGRPGADVTILQALVARHGSATLFSTSVVGELGAVTEVEISATAIGEGGRHLVLLLRDVGRRLGEHRPFQAELNQALEGLSREIGRESLKSLVSRTVELVERQLIRDALEMTDGNRTAAAELLGLSRQGLYTKLARYEIDEPSGG